LLQNWCGVAWLRRVTGLRLIDWRRVTGLSGIVGLSRRLDLRLRGLSLERGPSQRSRDSVLHSTGCLLELAEALADCAADLWQLPGSDHDQGYDQDNHQVRRC
jgi:hypothetical protein